MSSLSGSISRCIGNDLADSLTEKACNPSDHISDVFILDKPTNNLDIPILSILTNIIKSYRGKFLIVSHEEHFIKEIGVTKSIILCTML